MLDIVKEQRVRVFKNGRSRAVRIPKEFDFEGDEVTIRKLADGNLELIPDRRKPTPREVVEWLRSQPPLKKEDLAALDRFGDDNDMKPLDDIEL